MTRKWMFETKSYSHPSTWTSPPSFAASCVEIAVGLSAEQVETIRGALIYGDHALGCNHNRRFATALALLPKREPTLLEAAKAVLGWIGRNYSEYDGETTAQLRAAIAREEARKP